MRQRESDWDEAALAIQESGMWVRHTDTKAGVLATGLGVIAAAVITQARDIAAAMSTSDWRALLIAALVLGQIITFFGALRYVALTIRPHVDSTNSFNRFAWPSLARMTTAMRSGHYSSSVDEAWAQAMELASLAATKFRAFAIASRWFGVFIAISIAVIVMAYVI